MKIRGEVNGIAKKGKHFVQEVKGYGKGAQRLVVYASIIKLVK